MSSSFLCDLAALPLPPPEQFIQSVESRATEYISQYGANHLVILSLILVIRGLLSGD